MADLKAQIEITADASGVEAGVTKAKRSLKDLGTTAATEGRKASEGLSNAGRGADDAAKKVERSTRSLINSIQRTTAAMEAGSKSSSDYFRAIANQRGISQDALKPYLTQLDAVIAKQKAVGVSAAQTAAAMRGLPAQFTDIATQLAGGGNPFLVLLQQGGQIKDQFGGIGPALRGIASAINPVTVAVAGLAVGFGGLALAIASAEESARSFATIQAQLSATGRSGALGGNSDIKAFITELSQAPGVTRQVATEIISELSKVHEIGAPLFKDLARLAVDYAKATGTEIPAAAKTLAQAFKDPANGAKQLDQALGTLSSSQLQQIETLTRQNDLVGAQKVLFEALEGSIKGLASNALTPLQTATNDLGNAWDAAMRKLDASEGIRTLNSLLTRTVELVTFLVNNADKIGGLGTIGLTSVPGIGGPAALANAITSGLKSGPRRNPTASGKVTESVTAAAAATAAESVTEDAIKRGLALAATYKSDAERVREFRQEQEGLNTALKAAEQRYGKNSEQAKKLAAGIKGIDERIEQINKKGAGDAHSQLLAQGRLDIERIQAEAAEATNALTNQQKILDAQRAANLIEDRQYYAEKKRLAAESSQAQVDALEKENDALAAQKLTKADALNRDRQILVNQQKIAKLQADATANQTILDIQAAAAIETKTRAMQAAVAAAQQYVSTAGRQAQRDIEGMGRGNLQRQIDQQRNQREDQFLARSDVLNAQLRAKQINEQEFAQYMELERKAYESVLQIDREAWAARIAVMKDGVKGAQEVLQNYIDFVNDAYTRSGQIVSDGLRGFNDALTESTFTGDMSSWKSFGESLGRQVLSGIYETYVTSNLAQTLKEQLGGDSFFGDILQLITGGKGSGGAAGGASSGAATAAMASSATAASASLGALTAAASSAATALALIGANAVGSAGGDALGSFIGSMGWADGGYTGDGGKYQPAGIVHAGEFVLNKEATAGIGPTGRAFLERLNRRGYADGGFVSPISGGGSSSPIARSTTNNNVFNMNFSGNTSRDTASQVALRVSRELQRSGRDA